MTIINLLINENLLSAELALSRATSGNIVELCRSYLRLLTEYRDRLFDLRGIPEINIKGTTLARELILQSRNAVRSALETTTRERNRMEALLESFTSISGYEATDTFNQLKYKGSDNWELRSHRVGLTGGSIDESITVQEAVDAAGRLRRDAYIANKTTFFRD